ncbi:flagellar motor protein MotD [Oryzomicrobium sp.]|uniref:flagellar motor protein MotD n=1 Tax=Oryzomicrobium sp. TaxID=1911578 RepID=UPI0025E22021|nr:flagellar motor protein MotD [Oryzomicrobium sp.]MCE1241864.1 flagellar motor protein MotD [Oryzomicrobium sp.]
MAKRRRGHEDEHENLERWLVSYADFITLLFAFFVVMYAISSVNEGKYRVLSDSLVSAFRNVQIVGAGQMQVVTTPNAAVKQIVVQQDPKSEARRQAQREKMRNVAQDIFRVLAPLVRQGKVRLVETDKGVTIEIADSVLFSPGQAQLETTSVQALRMVGEVLAPTEFPIVIEGHTDNVPIRTSQYPSNWELSAVRATTVLRLFVDAGVSPQRLTAIGYGEHRPVESNDSLEGRARNRRVSILIESAIPLEPEAPPLAPPPEQPQAAAVAGRGGVATSPAAASAVGAALGGGGGQPGR